jgi:hypothetical protein
MAIAVMKPKIASEWQGLASLLWVVLVFVIIKFVVLTNELMFEPLWLFDLLLFAVWWGVGLAFAISGLRRGHFVSRFCAVLSICALVYFVWSLTRPVVAHGDTVTRVQVLSGG